MSFDALESIIAWVLPVAITLIGGLLALLRYFNDRQERGAQLLRAEIEALRGEVAEGDEANRTKIDECRSQHNQGAAELRLTIVEQKEKMAEHKLDIAERMLNKNDFRDFSNRLEERLGRMETKIDHLGTAQRA